MNFIGATNERRKKSRREFAEEELTDVAMQPLSARGDRAAAIGGDQLDGRRRADGGAGRAANSRAAPAGGSGRALHIPAEILRNSLLLYLLYILCLLYQTVCVK